MNPVDALARRGVTVSVDPGGKTRAAVKTPPDADLRAALAAAKPWLIAALTPDGEPWDAAEAVRLQVAADDLVARLGVSHPDVTAAAGLAAEAHADHDLAGVRAACAAVEAMARLLATPGGQA